MDEIFIYLIGGALIILVFALIFREFLCWYWKVNEIVDLLERIGAKLDTMDRWQSERGGYPSEVLRPGPSLGTTKPIWHGTAEEQTSGGLTCPKCGRRDRVEAFNCSQDGVGKCPSCNNEVAF
jgi:hypothetical protein